ncbi:O-antigen ligase [Sphingobium sp. CFD-2]|uniref:O-antigen ligase family protein n=1 Tax=Sphingobium sp. CFD-2 TaxID=2878542 RepID=UPI00214B6128|nr:O-antigen ligase family protein [Sphingobium sp. CFD-2]
MNMVNSIAPSRPSSAALTLLLFLLSGLWVAGGASHADVMSQVAIRTIAWLLLVIALLIGLKPSAAKAGAVAWLLAAALLLVLLQLVPLPPSIWTLLPGREPFPETSLGEPLWHSWSIVPWATVNAASSFIIPVVTLYLVSALADNEERWLPSLLLGMIFLSMLIGLWQFCGFAFDHPWVNDTPGSVSSIFANRNHFALFLAVSCIIAPGWAFSGQSGHRWRAPAALALVMLFALTILATGSRAGIVTGLLAIILGLALSWGDIRHEIRHAPRWAFVVLIASVIGVIALLVLISIAADRAESISRAFELDPGQDMRSRGLPTVLSMVATYFPAGAGFGSFDPIFRIHEPFALLKRTYFNHAHNDFLEVVLDGGLPALLLLLVSLGWYVSASIRVWRAGSAQHRLAKAGSGILLLILVASLTDYPARTPIFMAIIVIAGLWLSQGAKHVALRT